MNPREWYGPVMPAGFPTGIYDAIHGSFNQGNLKRGLMPDALLPKEFRSGWLNIQYAFRACAEHSAAYTSAVNSGDQENWDSERFYIIASSLLGFFSTGQAVLESASYAMLVLAGILEPAKVPLVVQQEKKSKQAKSKAAPTVYELVRANPETTRDIYTKHLADTKAASALAFVNDARWKEWKAFRNTLAHRSLPNMHLKIDVDLFGEHKTDWVRWELALADRHLYLNESTTVDRLSWLLSVTTDLIQGGYDLIDQRLSKIPR
jgi:hypothetical protein